MRRLVVFNQVTLDGYFAGSDGDISWAHKSPDDAEWNAFVGENASRGGALLFGRVTYEMMASYWPSPQAAANDPVVAEGMNRMPKAVVSRTLKRASWANTTVIGGDLVAAVRAIKAGEGPDIAILGSGSIVAQLTAARLIDEYQVVVCPLVLGEGRTMFDGIGRQIALELVETRVFGNGSVVLRYRPAD